MDFSEYTLVSFGDSFTFGQGSTLGSDLERIRRDLKLEGDKTDPRIPFKKISNRKSYTRLLETSMGFDGSINLGIPGTGNKRIFQIIKDFHRQNRNTDKKFFYIIGLTHAARDLIMTKNKVTNLYESYDFIFNNWEKDIRRPKTLRHPQEIHDLKVETFLDITKYYRNDYSVLIDYLNLYEDMINFLELNNIPYVMFDILNDMSWNIYRFDLKDKIGLQRWAELCLAGSEYYKFDDIHNLIDNHLELINDPSSKHLNYKTYQELEYYVNTETLIDYDVIPNMMVKYVDRHPIGNTDSPVEGDDHWNSKGHRVAMELIQYWIRKHYE